MENHYEFEISGHHNIYTNNPRKYNIYFSTPSAGVNEYTGILLLIPGYGGHSNSNIYRKMRTQFADEHNLVCVQCDYFGQEFMQQEVLEENIENFNDMSFMQAIDNINAVLFVVSILKKQSLTINYGKVILYGQSHGAYLSYLCNAFAPDLFTMLIDNSSYLYPIYLLSNRNLQVGNKVSNFHYIAADYPKENEIFYLPVLYSKFKNQCKIVSYNGSDDPMVPWDSKAKFCQNIHQCHFELITADKIDGLMFKSTAHGLGADFIYLFNHTLVHHDDLERKNELNLQTFFLQTNEHRFELNYDTDLLQFSALILSNS
ncbi:DUF2920 family protein [Paenibacillus profundus]|uniref:DUF2920 family protein n=1 Tax=Paenibacillus profundus TaxID=1173085 RepID=A0ABS8YEH8_9BACL|nr:DUF2920 family protein [Paenibacillus profundus]MCE5169324.1 DUF2920 family protein [Paenibacillus profundus]